MDLENRIALVTGGGRGIGKGCALALAEAGADLVLNDRPGSQELQTAAAEVRALGRTCHTVESDVFTRAGCEQLVADAVEAAGRIDILVSNPARGKRRPFLELTGEEFEEVIRCTLTAGFHVGQLVARHQAERGDGGAIVFISSVQAEMPFALSAGYNAAKAGLNKLAATMAVELFAHRIRVNVIEPGWIDTPGERIAFGEEAIRQEGPKLPWGRLGTPADIGRAATFLASDRADYVNGSVLRVDGGFFLKDFRLNDSLRSAESE